MKIGILYNLVDNIECGLELEILSDDEIGDPVEHVKSALENEHEVIPARISRELLPRLTKNSFDFVFNLCEGIGANHYGEAWVAALLDIIGIPYTGSDSLTLGLCLNKVKTKHLFIANNIPTPKYQLFYDLSQKLDRCLKFPLIVKPSHDDGGVGIKIDSVVHNEPELFKKVGSILKIYNQPALVEEYIDGRELTVAIIGNGNSLEILPISEMVFKYHENFPNIVSYEAKWIEDSEIFQKIIKVCPAELPEDVERYVKKLAEDAYHLTGCRDYARVDFRLKNDTPYVLEVNPNPWIDMDGNFVKCACTAGMSYDGLIQRILSEAMKRYKMDVQREKKRDEIHETTHLTASSVKLKHVPLLMRWFNDYDLTRYMEPSEEPITREWVTEKFLVLNHEDVNLIISEKESNKEIGYCSIYGINRSNQSAEFSYLIGEKQFQGKGYGKEIVELLLHIAFHKMGLNSITAIVTQQNTRSVRVFEKMGFR